MIYAGQLERWPAWRDNGLAVRGRNLFGSCLVGISTQELRGSALFLPCQCGKHREERGNGPSGSTSIRRGFRQLGRLLAFHNPLAKLYRKASGF